MSASNAERAQIGVQESLVFFSTPSGSQLTGTRVIDGGPLAAGTYTCKFRVDGLSRVDVFLKATLGTGTVTVTGGTTYDDGSTVRRSFSNLGTLTDDTLRWFFIKALAGEKFCLLTLVVTGTDQVEFSQAEYSGPPANSDYASSLALSAASHAAIDISGGDATLEPGCRGIYVGTAGHVQCTVAGVSELYKNVAAGSILPVEATLVSQATTTAADLVALY